MKKHNILYTPPYTLFIPIGTPLMGKSTWIKHTLPRSVAVISRDGIRKAISRPVSLGIAQFYETITDSDVERAIEHLWFTALRWNMERQVPIALDTTNLTHKGRNNICTLAHEHGYHTVPVVFATRSSLRDCINLDIDILYSGAKALYSTALKTRDKRKYESFIRSIGISSSLCQNLLTRNFIRLKREGIFINTRVLAAMLKRMYHDYPSHAYLPSDIKRVVITDIPSPCQDRPYKHPKHYVAQAKRPEKPTMESKEW